MFDDTHTYIQKQTHETGENMVHVLGFVVAKLRWLVMGLKGLNDQ